MGAGQSGGVEIGGSSMGYQVLRVYPNSPGSRAGLKAYFDFIVAIGNIRFNKEDGSLREILKASVNQELKMIVYNTRNKLAREVEIVPTTSWGGSGLLGVSIKHSSFDKADERVWHVVEVDPGSPAHQAGFKASEDYVIGSDSILQESDDLYNLIEAHEGKALKLFVYNSKTDNCREVVCHPNSKWGGRGFLGCEFGHGLLHRIPHADGQAAGRDQEFPISTSQNNNVTMSLQSSLMSAPQLDPPQQPQLPTMLPQRSTQPGHQMFQHALSNQSSTQQQQQSPQKPEERPPILPAAPQAPQTFAQLASAQFQAQHHEQQSAHQQDQKFRQMESPDTQPPKESTNITGPPLFPQRHYSSQDGLLLSNDTVAPQHLHSGEQPFQDDPMLQFVQDNVHDSSQQPPQNGPPLPTTETSPPLPQGPPPQQHQYSNNQGSYFNYQQEQYQNQSMIYGNQMIQPNLQRSIRSLPPPPNMYPSPPLPASSQQQQQQQQQLPPPPPPPVNIPNFNQL